MSKLKVLFQVPLYIGKVANALRKSRKALVIVEAFIELLNGLAEPLDKFSDRVNKLKEDGADE